MNLQILTYAMILLIAGIFSIATSSIGVQCHNKNEEYKRANESNQTFLIVNLVSAVMVTLVACFGIYSGVVAV
jgi:uncharacterized membrane protein